MSGNAYGSCSVPDTGEEPSNQFAIYTQIRTLPGGREELIPEIKPEFPYAAIDSQHNNFTNKFVPWHWHQEIEVVLCYGNPVEYDTPHEHVVLTKGMVALINANVVHSTHAKDDADGANLYVHLFRPQLIAEPGSRIWERYIEPLINTTSIELMVASPEGSALEQEICAKVARAFKIFENGDAGWEMRLRDQLAEAWLDFFELAQPHLGGGPAAMPTAASERIKTMLEFVYKHYAEHISVADIAAAAFSSERECHRTFKSELGLSPAQYLRDYRVQQACRMLAHTTRPMATVAQMSGLGTPSHFGQVFRETMGCTPTEYRSRWQ